MTAAGVMMLAGCIDDRDNYMVDDMVSYVKPYGVEDVSVLDESFELTVIKSGKGRTSADVTVAVADTALQNYNARMRRTDPSYAGSATLDGSLFGLSDDKFQFSESDTRKILNVNWEASKVLSALKAGDKAIPFKLFSTGTEVNADRDLVILHPVMTTLKMDAVMAPGLTPSLDMEKKDTCTATMSINIPVNTKDIDVELAIDNSLISSYNTANSTAYEAAPSGLVTLKEDKVTIARGQSSVSFKYILDVSKFYKDGALTEFTSYLVPIKVKSVSVKGLELGESVLYVPVTPLVEKTLMGPWNVIEGADLCYGREPDRPAWAAKYLVDRMVDGDLTTEWISIWEHDNVYPLVFAFDLGDSHLFKKFKIKDHQGFQSNLRDYEMYMASEYKGADTEWTLIAKGMRDGGWVSGGGTYDFPVQTQSIGRYLKFVILKTEFAWTGDYVHGRGKICEIYGEGL